MIFVLFSGHRANLWGCFLTRNTLTRDFFSSVRPADNFLFKYVSFRSVLSLLTRFPFFSYSPAHAFIYAEPPLGFLPGRLSCGASISSQVGEQSL